MTPSDEYRLNHTFARIERRLPRRARRPFRWLRKPSSRWLRIPLGILFAIGGIFGFLPVLGLWMLPLGLLLLAQDVPFLRHPLLAILDWLERRWIRRKKLRRRKR